MRRRQPVAVSRSTTCVLNAGRGRFPSPQRPANKAISTSSSANPEDSVVVLSAPAHAQASALGLTAYGSADGSVTFGGTFMIKMVGLTWIVMKKGSHSTACATIRTPTPPHNLPAACRIPQCRLPCCHCLPLHHTCHHVQLLCHHCCLCHLACLPPTRVYRCCAPILSLSSFYCRVYADLLTRPPVTPVLPASPPISPATYYRLLTRVLHIRSCYTTLNLYSPPAAAYTSPAAPYTYLPLTRSRLLPALLTCNVFVVW